MAALDREDSESRAQSDYLERKEKEEAQKKQGRPVEPSLITSMPIKGEEPRKEIKKVPDELDLNEIPTGEFIRILRGVEEKLQKTRMIHDNALKRTYIQKIREIEAQFIEFEIPTGSHKSYLDLLENARQLSLSFRLEEDERRFSKRIDRHIEFFETIRQDFLGKGKWTRLIKICMYIFMACLFVLLPPLVNMAVGQISFWTYIISFVLAAAAVLAFGLYVIKQVEKRKRMSMILMICVSPIALLAGGFWFVYGMNILMGFEEYMRMITESIAAGGMTASPGYTKFVVMTLPVIGAVLIIDVAVMLGGLIKNRKLFTA